MMLYIKYDKDEKEGDWLLHQTIIVSRNDSYIPLMKKFDRTVFHQNQEFDVHGLVLTGNADVLVEVINMINRATIDRIDGATSLEETYNVFVQQMFFVHREHTSCEICTIADDKDVFLLLLHDYPSTCIRKCHP